MCRLSDAELNWVSTKMRWMSACRQPLIGISIRRYLPPIGTAGLDRVAVKGKSREPCPPPRMTASVSFIASHVQPCKLPACPERSKDLSFTQNRRRGKKNSHIIALDIRKYVSADQSANSILEEIRRQGGLSIACHPHHRTSRRIESTRVTTSSR